MQHGAAALPLVSHHCVLRHTGAARFPRMPKWADFDMRGDSGLGSARLHGSRKCAYLLAALSCRPAAAGLPPADLQLIERAHTPRF